MPPASAPWPLPLCKAWHNGKSHVAQALGHAACVKGFDVLYMKPGRLLADLGGGHADGTWATRFRRYLQPDLLILDDFGLREFTVPQAEDLAELICERHRQRSQIVVSNRAPQDWYTLFPNPVLAEGALDRLINRSHHVFMTGKSHRPMYRPDRQVPPGPPLLKPRGHSDHAHEQRLLSPARARSPAPASQEQAPTHTRKPLPGAQSWSDAGAMCSVSQQALSARLLVFTYLLFFTSSNLSPMRDPLPTRVVLTPGREKEVEQPSTPVVPKTQDNLKITSMISDERH